nr:MAG TPA: tumor necrosis factor receptor [Caudoviricetes sp.]DAW84226.1 MAG TPA: tumor necrosis factor receptor [Bacteriophage sp.]
MISHSELTIVLKDCHSPIFGKDNTYDQLESKI